MAGPPVSTSAARGRTGWSGRPRLEEAVLTAARAIRQTGKPVGLLMWRGRHAWVMSGFRATGDPLVPGTRVTAVIVEDPLYPYGSSTWGPSPAPGEALSLTELGRQYVPRRTSSQFQRDEPVQQPDHVAAERQVRPGAPLPTGPARASRRLRSRALGLGPRHDASG